MMPVTEMYSQVYRLNTSGVDGYDVEKKYADPLKQMKERYYLTVKKGRKVNNLTVTDRGSYLKDHIKQTEKNPGPGQYKSLESWPQKSKSLAHASKKKTYLDDIIDNAKK